MRNDILYGIGMLLAASGVERTMAGSMSPEPSRTIRVRSPGSENINVAMGAVSQRQFYRAGDGSAGNLLLSIYRTAVALPAA